MAGEHLVASADWTAVLRVTEQQLQAWSRLCRERLEAAQFAGAVSGGTAADSAALAPTVPGLDDVAAALEDLGLRLLAQAEQLRAGRFVDERCRETAGGVPAPPYPHAAEAERARLARDLHDGPAQYFAQAVAQVSYLERLLAQDPAAVGPELADLRAQLQRGVTALRGCMFDLRLPAVESFGLVALLRAYLQDFTGQTGIQVEATLPAVEVSLTPDRAAGLFRIAQEALTNAGRHAEARRIAVSLEQDGDVLVLRVEDDGRGFAPAAPPGKYGLRGMRERAALVGAHLAIDSQPGEGARVIARALVR